MNRTLVDALFCQLEYRPIPMTEGSTTSDVSEPQTQNSVPQARKSTLQPKVKSFSQARVKCSQRSVRRQGAAGHTYQPQTKGDNDKDGLLSPWNTHAPLETKERKRKGFSKRVQVWEVRWSLRSLQLTLVSGRMCLVLGCHDMSWC
ncbi:hypothetical protein VFPPC_16618 [Pochonia chlamydosporia 170]|uniref:Uncharacterized protein n=1 Tax=Pochonia chlamydosporia 170 TaxID=1380566 RepID=A0A179FA41_METCM|nr:hypothetical protein VFPPC_16618 [Pochonia chlamydosporia 170]OAQ62151.2 hypothetical protein VFPPC_16618 [Pochonia chlamydosporia 170]